MTCLLFGTEPDKLLAHLREASEKPPAPRPAPRPALAYLRKASGTPPARAHGGSAFALRVLSEDSSAGTTEVALKYNHFDHLGSVTAMSDELGRVIGPASGGTNATLLGYDPWGARRNPDGTAADSASFALHVGHREYTGHETIPNVGLVNMNGRVYDPELGRFLSADPNVQFVADLQSYNRYSYVLNNPLRYTDPTGYGIFSFLKNPFFWLQTLPMTAMCIAGGPIACIVSAVYLTVVNSSVMLTEGASWGQVAKTAGVSLGAGMLGGALGGWAVSGWQNGGVYAAMLSGAIGGAISTAAAAPLLGGDLGWNVLAGAMMGAATAGIRYGFRHSAPVSQASGGRYLSPDPNSGPDWYTLSDEGTEALKPTFDKLGYDVDRVKVHVGDSIYNIGGRNRAIGDSIYLCGDTWSLKPPEDQLFVLAHEIAHSMQWDQGHITFAVRYLLEEINFPRQDQYYITEALRQTPLSEVDMDTSIFRSWEKMPYSLDEIADRIAYEVSPTSQEWDPRIWYPYRPKARSSYGY